MSIREEPQRCETLRDVQLQSGGRVILVGTYHDIDLRMRQKSPPQYAGHVAIKLKDGTDVLLEPGWSAASIRGPEERARYGGKRVEVTGTIHHQAPPPPEPIAYVMGPCLSPVEVIGPAAEEPAA
jgi:hypothetical protein